MKITQRDPKVKALEPAATKQRRHGTPLWAKRGRKTTKTQHRQPAPAAAPDRHLLKTCGSATRELPRVEGSIPSKAGPAMCRIPRVEERIPLNAGPATCEVQRVKALKPWTCDRGSSKSGEAFFLKTWACHT